jgi:hypothetical protein
MDKVLCAMRSSTLQRILRMNKLHVGCFMHPHTFTPSCRRIETKFEVLRDMSLDVEARWGGGRGSLAVVHTVSSESMRHCTPNPYPSEGGRLNFVNCSHVMKLISVNCSQKGPLCTSRKSVRLTTQPRALTQQHLKTQHGGYQLYKRHDKIFYL